MITTDDVTLEFPATSALGTVMIVNREARERSAVEARGSVPVPAGRLVLIQVDGGALAELAATSSIGPASVVVNGAGPDLVDAVIALGVTSLSLRGDAAPGALNGLDRAATLEDFALHHVPLAAEDAAALAALPALRAVRVDGAADAGTVAGLAGVTGLTTLVLTGTTLGPDLPALAALTRLEQLVLRADDLTDAAVAAAVAGMPALQSLSLHGPQLDGSLLAAVPALPALASLSYDTELPIGERIIDLLGAPVLADLELSCPVWTDDVAYALEALSPPLVTARLKGGDPTDDAPPLSLNAQVWLALERPELSVNGNFFAPRILERYRTAGLGVAPVRETA